MLPQKLPSRPGMPPGPALNLHLAFIPPHKSAQKKQNKALEVLSVAPRSNIGLSATKVTRQIPLPKQKPTATLSTKEKV